MPTHPPASKSRGGRITGTPAKLGVVTDDGEARPVGFMSKSSKASSSAVLGSFLDG